MNFAKVVAFKDKRRTERAKGLTDPVKYRSIVGYITQEQ